MLDVGRPRQLGHWSEAALKVLRERYLASNDQGQQETPEEMCWRVALAIAQAEEKWGRSLREVYETAEAFYGLMVEGLFLPNSPTLMNAGKANGLQYSACFVLPVEDSLEGIFETVKRAAIIHKSGGGTGFAFSRLRSKDSQVRSTGGKASGPVSFMRVFNAATEAVKQGGTRRGANMGILRVDHPDILEFIECKLDGGIANFNISVAATDKFMDALVKDEEYELVEPHTQEIRGRLRASEVFDRIVRAAWQTGDPGMVFIERVNRSPANPIPELETIESTNPCGEQPLAPNDACNLGSINLARFALNGPKRQDPAGGRWPSEPAEGIPFPDSFSLDPRIDWPELERVTRLAVRFLDDVIEVNPYPLPEIATKVHANRRIGLGVMGWADLLVQLRIPYASDEALHLAEEVMGFIHKVGHDESIRLAQERGPFPTFPHSIYRHGPPRRNATVTTIAPTGTLSIIAGCSSGIEPLYALAYSHIVGDRHLSFVNPYFEAAAREHGLVKKPELMDQVARQGTLQGLAGVPEELRRVFATAHEIAPESHVRMQAAFQKYTDNGVSKTINLPRTATVEDVARAYLLAYELGCLGITVFRDGCKETQVLHAGSQRPAESSQPLALRAESGELKADIGVEQSIKPRPRIMAGVTYRVATPLGTAFITVNSNGQGESFQGKGEPFEVFISVGKAGSDTAAVSEAMGRLISLCLRLASPLSPTDRVREIVGQLSGIGGGRSLGFGKERVRSLPDAIAHVLAEHIGARVEGKGNRVEGRGLREEGKGLREEGNRVEGEGLREEGKRDEGRGNKGEGEGLRMEEGNPSSLTPHPSPLSPLPSPLDRADLCPQCGHAALVPEEGCQKCYSCGYTEC